MDQAPKVHISPAADVDLEAMLTEVNEGFTSGRVKKAQLASWIFSAFRKKYFARHIKGIRADHFDQIAHLKAIVRQMEEAKQTNANVELGKLLQPLKASGPKSRKNAAHENR